MVALGLLGLLILPHNICLRPRKIASWQRPRRIGFEVPMRMTLPRRHTRQSTKEAASIWILFSYLDPFHNALIQSQWTDEQKKDIAKTLEERNLYSSSPSVTCSSTLLSICRGLTSAEMSQMLIQDFQIEPLMANQIRTLVVRAIDGGQQQQQSTHSKAPRLAQLATQQEVAMKELETTRIQSSQVDSFENVTTAREQPSYKAAIVNQAAVRRRNQQKALAYQLDVSRFPLLQQQLNNFYQFMTEPSTLSQEDPIRPATATVYLLHAKLFLGWYVSQHGAKGADKTDPSLSLDAILSSKDKESATIVIQFVMWLRKERQISMNYEANLLRGIIKLLKFCFANESIGGDNRKTYEDIPVIQELRRLHRNAYKQAKLAPKSSNEGQKWLSWPEYLQVVQATKADFDRLVAAYQESDDVLASGKDSTTPMERKIAIAFQRYLVLAIFTNVPDRQRTIRELEIGRTLVKEQTSAGSWYIKHNPGDYKTGATYGERPPMLLSSALSVQIDEFINDWRPKLKPTTDFLFVQPKTGNPFTRDSVYSAVSRACYEHAGKRTNPHLLRDMIVTHVRESNASEKELEALALYMGHSINMQRTSYDRRTLERKVAPAIELLQTVNSQTQIPTLRDTL